MIAIIEQIPFYSLGTNIILASQRHSHYKYYYQGLLGFIFQFLLPFCSQLYNLLVYCLLLQWQNFPSGINKVNRISSYLILSHVHGTPCGYYRPAADKLVLSRCLLALKRYQSYSICSAFYCQQRKTLLKMICRCKINVYRIVDVFLWEVCVCMLHVFLCLCTTMVTQDKTQHIVFCNLLVDKVTYTVQAPT